MTTEPATPKRSEAGFTLVETLLAAMLLGLAIMPIFTSLSVCLKTMGAAREFQKALWVFGTGSLEYPLTDSEEVRQLDELVVEADSQMCEGFTFSRSIDPKVVENSETDDGLYVLRTRVQWGEGGEGESLEQVRYIWKKGAGDYP